MIKAKEITLGLGAIALILGVSGAMVSTADAYRGDPNVIGPNYSTLRHTAMEKAFETNDYLAWKNLMQNQGRVTQLVNKDNFIRFVEAHSLAEKGDIEGAKKIRQEMNLGLKNVSEQGMGYSFEKGMKRGNNTNR